MANYNGVIKIDLSWTSLKSVASLKNLAIQYDSSASEYDIFCLDNNIAYVTTIFRGSVPDTTRYNQTQNDTDKADFEASYKDIVTNRATSNASAIDGYNVNTTNPILIAGSDGTLIRTVKVDTTGHLVAVGQGVAGTPAGGVISIQGVAGGTTVPVSGTVTVANASVSTTGTAPPGSATYIGGSVTTAAPTYTTGQMNALSLTTAGALRIDGSAVTQPVSGTVTANIGTTNGLALDATLTGGTQTTRITDGTNTATVKAASTAAVATDKAVVVAISPNNTVGVTGTVTANIGTTNGLALDATLAKLTITQGTALGTNTQAMVGGSVTTAAPTYTTGNVNPLSLTTAGALRIDGSGVTQPVSGTVTANIGTTNGLALDTSVNGILVAQGSTTSGEKGPLIQGAVTTAAPTYTTAQTSPLSLTTAGALRTDSSATTQPVSGTVAATQSGTWTVQPGNTANTTPWLTTINQGGNSATVTGANALKVDGSAVTQPVSGTVTANIGTTNGLALDATLAKLTIAQGATLGANTQAMVGGSVTTASPTYTTGQISPLSLTTAGALRVDGSAVTQPVSGTITANAGTGNFTVAQATASNLRAQTASEAATAAATPGTAGLMGGAVTTAAPSYTTGQMDPLSLTTTGLLRVDGSGVTQPVSGTVTSNIGTTNGLALDATLAKLTITQGTALGANTQALMGGSVTTAAPTYTTGQISPLSLTTAGALRTDGSATVQPVSGTVTATNPSVSTTGAAPPASATYIGGSVTTAAPAYTTGQMSALSLTTTGLLRIDGSGVTQPVSGTVTANIGTTNGLALDATLAKLTVAQGATLGANTQAMVGGSVTTAAPTYTTGQISPLSLSTAGALRVDGSGVTQPVSGTVTANAGTGNFTVVQATAANLRTQTASESTTASATGTIANLIGGAVTTAAPTYTTGQMDPLSLTTAGALRIDGSGVTQPVSGTVTANIGTTNGLALDTTLAKLTVAQGAALGANTQAMVGGSVTTAAPTYTTGQISPLSLSTAGALRIDGSGVTQPVSGTVTANQGGAPWSQNVTQFGGVNISTGTGASGTGIPRVTVANDSNILATQSGTWTVQPGNTANTTPWLTTINQGGNSAAVKAASTAAVATDPALVVAISPNNAISVGPVTVSQSDTTGTGNLNALNATSSVVLAGTMGCAMQLLAGTLVGTIVPEVSVDGGTTWVAAFFDDPATGNKVSSIVFGSANTATTRSIVGTGGSSNVRIRVSAFTSGAATCNVRASSQNDPTVFFDGAAGSALAPTIAQVGGSVTTAAPTYTTATMNALSLTTAGALRTDSSATTQPISGTVTANIGTSGSLALDATLAAMSLVDNAPFTDGTTRVQPVGYVFDEVAGTALTENDIAAARVDSKRAQVGVIEDATTRGTRATVKAASTPAVVTDTALVVAISPNTVVNPDTIATGALGALAATVQVNCSGLQTVGIQLAAGTLAGTIIPEFSWDGGTTWSPGYFIGPASLGAVASLVLTNPNAAAGKMVAVIGGAGLVRIRVSAYTSGTANITLRASAVIAEFVGLAGAQAGAVNPPMVLQVGGTDGTDLRALSTDTNGRLNVNETNQLATSSYPDPSSIISGTSIPTIDAFGNLETRGTVLTDEGSFRDDFTGSGLTTTLTGTLTFTASSTSITGAGTTFTTQVIAGQWIKKSADAETLYAQVATVVSDTQLTLTTAYAGTSTATTAVVSNWKTVTATGGTITVATSSVSLTSGTTSGQQSSIQRLGDFLPYTFQVNLSVSQRIANQTIIIGFMDTFSATPIKQATIQFSGTTNTTLNFVTSFGSAAADTQTTAVTIPNAGTSATSHTYKIDLSGTQASLSIDGILVATNATHIPGPYDNINIFAGTLNTAAAGSSTTLAIDFIYFLNADRLQIDNDFRGEPLPVTSKIQPIYGTSGQSVTITMTSLAAAASRASTSVDNTTNLYEDVYLFFKMATNAAGTSTTGYINVYGYASVDNGTTYPEAITGTDAAITLTSPPNLVLLAQINANTNGATKTYGPISFCRTYGLDRLPAKWGVVVQNQTGAAFTATAGNYAVTYQGVNGQMV